jgi:hypothetical protein
MTEPERAALEHIRQVIDSVIGVPAPPEPAPPEPASLQANPNILPIQPMPHSGEEIGIPHPDSGAEAGALLLNAYLDSTITPADFSVQAGRSADNPLSFTQIMNGLGVNGLSVELRGTLKLADLSLILFSGRPVITPVQPAILQQAGLMQEKMNEPFFVLVVGMDVKQVFIHNPFGKDVSTQTQGIPWLTFYQAWSQAKGYERAALVPRQQLLRRVRVTAILLDVFGQPGGDDASPAGTASLGDVYEVTRQKNGWGRIAEDRWINLSYTADI